MKVCHQCQETYRDHVDFCFRDGEVLVPAEGSPAVSLIVPDTVADIDDSGVPTEALPRRHEPLPIRVEDADEDDLMDLFAEPGEEEPELTQALPRNTPPPDPAAVEVDAPGPEAPWAADIPPAREPTLLPPGVGADDDDDDETIDDDPTPLAGVLEAELMEAAAPPPVPVPAPPPEPKVPELPTVPEVPVRDGDTDIGTVGALDEVGIGGPPPPDEEDSDEGEEHATVGEPPPPRPHDPELTDVRGPPPASQIHGPTLDPAGDITQSDDMPHDSGPEEPRLGSASGALAGLGRRPLAEAPSPSTVQPVGEHPVPTAPRSRPLPPRSTPQPANGRLLAGSDSAGLVVVGLGITAVAMLVIVVVAILLLTNCTSLFAEAPAEPPAVAAQPEPAPAAVRTPHEPDAAFREQAVDPVDSGISTGGAVVPLARGLRANPNDDGMVLVFFKTDPPGATIRVDDQEVDAPGPVRLPAGATLRYEISHEGYLPFRNRISVPFNQSEVDASSRPIRLRLAGPAAPSAAPAPAPAPAPAAVAAAAPEPRSLSFSPTVWADPALNGCGLVLDGSPVRPEHVVGDEPVLPMKLRELTLGIHEFKIVGADPKCGGHAAMSVEFDGRQSLTLGSTAP